MFLTNIYLCIYSWLGVWDLELGAEYWSGVTHLKMFVELSKSSGLSLPLPLVRGGAVLDQLICGGDGGKFCIVCECCIADGKL